MKILKPLTALVVLTLTLSSCSVSRPTSAQLSASSISMLGVTTASFRIDADPSLRWRLDTNPSWLEVQPSEGEGSKQISVIVHPEGLQPNLYGATIKLIELDTGASRTIPVTFAFPRLTGRILKGSGPSLLTLTSEQFPESGGRLLVGLRSDGRSPSFQGAEEPYLVEIAESAISGIPGTKLLDVAAAARVATYETTNLRRTAQMLRHDPRVRYVEPDRLVERLSNDEYRDLQWALDIMQVEPAWATGKGTEIDVAVIDGGYEPGHPDIGFNQAYVYNFEYQTSSVSANAACGSHGLHVAGIISAVADNSLGIAGIAPESDLNFLDVSANDFNCSIRLSSIIRALEWVAGDGTTPNADVVNISLGTNGYSQALHDAIYEVYSQGVTIVAAAGNDPDAVVMYPAAHPEVIAVAATGANDESASYSASGPEIHVSAPGGNVVTSSAEAILSTIYEGDYDYAYMQGTSMASPAVAGIAALILSVDPTLNPEDVAQVLATSSVEKGAPGWDEVYGFGRVDAEAAVAEASSYGGESYHYLVAVDSASAVTVPFHGGFDFGYVDEGTHTLNITSSDGTHQSQETVEVSFNGPETYSIVYVDPQ